MSSVGLAGFCSSHAGERVEHRGPATAGLGDGVVHRLATDESAEVSVL
jgi:hypothetical protein